MSDELLSHEIFGRIEEKLVTLDREMYVLLKKAFTVGSLCILSTTTLDDARRSVETFQRTLSSVSKLADEISQELNGG